ncbi:hypothetical protein FB1_12710 [Flavobacterium branchiophilum NBRC 15030 = ATCC 35035]|nr:hypothetical protein FB1_12710 [Flavobacterium branchiophilum NBRC 15030 = ATCC 35035]
MYYLTFGNISSHKNNIKMKQLPPFFVKKEATMPLKNLSENFFDNPITCQEAHGWFYKVNVTLAS